MNRKVVAAVLLVLVVVVVALGIGSVAYQMGVSQGMMTTGTAVAPAPGAPPVFYGAPFGFYRPFRFGFGPFGCIFPILGFLAFFFLLRVLFWGGRGWGGGGHWSARRAEMFEQWHREAHTVAGSPGAAPAAPASQPRRE